MGVVEADHESLRGRWGLDPDTIHLNHAAYGACPNSVLEYQSELRCELEARPDALL